MALSIRLLVPYSTSTRVPGGPAAGLWKGSRSWRGKKAGALRYLLERFPDLRERRILGFAADGSEFEKVTAGPDGYRMHWSRPDDPVVYKQLNLEWLPREFWPCIDEEASTCESLTRVLSSLLSAAMNRPALSILPKAEDGDSLTDELLSNESSENYLEILRGDDLTCHASSDNLNVTT